MKIQKTLLNVVNFKDISIAEIFKQDNNLYIKVEDFFTNNDVYNALNIETGQWIFMRSNDPVQIINYIFTIE